MTVGNRHYAGKGAREEAAAALSGMLLSWRNDQSLQTRASFRGFEIMSRGRGESLILSFICFASSASSILAGRSLGTVQFLKRCGMIA